MRDFFGFRRRRAMKSISKVLNGLDELLKMSPNYALKAEVMSIKRLFRIYVQKVDNEIYDEIISRLTEIIEEISLIALEEDLTMAEVATVQIQKMNERGLGIIMQGGV